MRNKLLLSLLALIFLLPINQSNAATIKDGDLIRAQGGIDVYIVKVMGGKQFKRHILNPEIFNSYGHLRWENIKDVPQETVDDFATSNLVMEIYSGGRPVSGRVYVVSAENYSNGEKRFLNISPEQFEEMGYNWESIYSVNHKEASEVFYATGSNIFWSELQQLKEEIKNLKAELQSLKEQINKEGSGDEKEESQESTTTFTVQVSCSSSGLIFLTDKELIIKIYYDLNQTDPFTDTVNPDSKGFVNYKLNSSASPVKIEFLNGAESYTSTCSKDSNVQQLYDLEYNSILPTPLSGPGGAHA